MTSRNRWRGAAVAVCLAIGLLLLGGRPEAAVTVVDHDYLSSNASTSSIQLTMNGVQVGDVIGVCLNYYNNGSAGATISDDDANSYTESAAIYDAANDIADGVMAWAVAKAAGDVVITGANDSAINTYKGMIATVFRGVQASPLDDADQASGSSTAVATPALTATTDGVLFGCTIFDAASTVTETGGATLLREDETYTDVSMAASYEFVAAGSHTITWTLGTSAPWGGMGLVFKATPTGTTKGACCISTTGVGVR